jgi:galactan 5-O-arabinofuranosyltransferase
MDMNTDLRKLAQDVPYPDGRFPVLSNPDTRASLGDDPTVDELAAAIRGTARQAGQPTPGPLLTDDMGLLATTPFHAYQQWWSLYASPLGEYTARRGFLEGLQDRTPEEIVRELRANPAAPTVFLLKEDKAGHPTFSSADWDPLAGSSTFWKVTLPPELFEGDEFVTTRVGDWTVAALRTR